MWQVQRIYCVWQMNYRPHHSLVLLLPKHPWSTQQYQPSGGMLDICWVASKYRTVSCSVYQALSTLSHSGRWYKMGSFRLEHLQSLQEDWIGMTFQHWADRQFPSIIRKRECTEQWSSLRPTTLLSHWDDREDDMNHSRFRTFRLFFTRPKRGTAAWSVVSFFGGISSLSLRSEQLETFSAAGTDWWGGYVRNNQFWLVFCQGAPCFSNKCVMCLGYRTGSL